MQCAQGVASCIAAQQSYITFKGSLKGSWLGRFFLLNRRKKRGQEQDYRGNSGEPHSEEMRKDSGLIREWKVSLFLEIHICTHLVIGLFLVNGGFFHLFLSIQRICLECEQLVQKFVRPDLERDFNKDFHSFWGSFNFIFQLISISW